MLPAFVRPGGASAARCSKSVELEAGGELAGGEVLSAHAPYGYHHLVMRDGSRRQLVTSPGRCALPDALERVGLGGAAVRGPLPRRVGDRRSRRPARARVLVSQAGRGDAPGQPAARRAPGDAAGVEPVFPVEPPLSQPDLSADSGSAGRSRRTPSSAACSAKRTRCERAPIIDRDRIMPLKLRALEALWSRLPWRCRFRRVRRSRRAAARALRLLLRAGRTPRRDRGRPGPRATGVRTARPSASSSRATARGSTSIAGCSGRSTRSSRAPVARCRWSTTSPSASRPTALTRGSGRTRSPERARIGAPPDDFNPAGQDWGVPPFDPARLRAAGYAPLVATLRRMMAAGIARAHRPRHGPVPALVGAA